MYSNASKLCYGLFWYLKETNAAEIATNRDQKFISEQNVVVNGSVVGTLRAMKPPQRMQFSSLDAQCTNKNISFKNIRVDHGCFLSPTHSNS